MVFQIFSFSANTIFTPLHGQGYQSVVWQKKTKAFSRLSFSSQIDEWAMNPYESIWVFPKIGVPQNGWFITENPIKMDDLGAPLFSETPIWIYMNSMNSSTTHTSIWTVWTVFRIPLGRFFRASHCPCPPKSLSRWPPMFCQKWPVRPLKTEGSCFHLVTSCGKRCLHFFSKRGPPFFPEKEVRNPQEWWRCWFLHWVSFSSGDFFQTPAMRFPMSGGLWTCSTSKIKKKNTSAALLQITIINHPTTKGTTWNQRSNLFLLCAKKKQAPKSSLVAQMGVDMNPRPWWLWYIWLGSTLPQPTTLPDGPCFFLDTSTRRKQTNTMFVKKSAYRF